MISLMFLSFLFFYKNKQKFLRLHNIKYLKENNQKYQDFFLNLYPKDILDINKQNAILSMEDQITFSSLKNSIPFIVSKIKYLVEQQDNEISKILVIAPNSEYAVAIKKELIQKKLSEVKITNIVDLKKEVLQEEETELEEKLQYQVIRDYILFELFPNKKEFSEFYQAFGNYIYLNKDYQEFDTFRDYHHYLYKRKYLSTGLSLKKYNEQEIKKRRNQLRTICNEMTNSKTEVDIANFLYLNQLMKKC